MTMRARRARQRRSCCSVGNLVRLGMVLGMAGLVALQLALLTGYTHDSATEVGLARPATVDAQDNRGADADRDDGDDNIDSLETLDGAYDAEGNDDLGSGDTEIEAENNGEADGDDGVDDAAPLTVFSENWLSWMKMVEPDQGARKPIEFGHQAELDVDTWLAQSLARLTLPPARVPESGTAQPNSKDLQKIRRSVAHTLGKLESDEYKRAMVMEMSILDGILRDASSDTLLSSSVAPTQDSDRDDESESSTVSAAHHAKVSETADDQTCARWRAATSKTEAHTITRRVFSVAGNLPQAHADLWRRALAAGSESRKSAWEEDGNVENAGDDLHRLLVLPWTKEAALLEVGDQFSQRNDPYYLTLTRAAPGAGPSGWALIARRQELLSKLRDYMGSFTCSLESLGIVAPSYEVVANREDCQRLFAQAESAQQAKSAWLLKAYATTLCPAQGPGPCVEAQSAPQVLVGLSALQRQYGRCQDSAVTPVLIERAVPAPLLVHSRRLKWHVLVLVASSDPWKTFFHPGFVTFATPDARTERSGPTGSTVASTEALVKETTDLHKQAPFQTRGEQEPPLWDFARFLRYLESYGICERPCETLLSRTRAITRLLVEATRRGSARPLPRLSPRFSDFQVFRVDFWITESLQPVLHRGSADLGFLLDDWGPSAESLRSEMAGLLAEAVSLTENPAASATLWEPLQDELTDFCRGAEPRTFNPCSEIEPKPLLLPVRASQAGSPRTNKGVDTSSVSNSIGASSQGGGEELGDDEELDTNGMAPPVRILDWDARKFSPKSPVRMERRGAPVPLDEL